MPHGAITHRTLKKWLRISVTCDPVMSDALVGRLTGFTGSGVEILAVPADGVGRSERIVAYLEIDPRSAADDLLPLLVRLDLATLQDGFPGAPEVLLRTETIAEEDWNNNWKKHFKPLAVTPHLWIRPSWEPTIKGAAAVLEMDPGLAFGTGHHQSTRLALGLIDQLCFAHKKIPARVLDVGTGTGILAMACARFGSRQVLALDNDPDAVTAARENVVRNHLAHKVTVSDQPVAALADRYQGCFDLVTANITHDVLINLAPVLTRLLAPGGGMILAGILQGDQETSLLACYGRLGLTGRAVEKRDEWVALVMGTG